MAVRLTQAVHLAVLSNQENPHRKFPFPVEYLRTIVVALLVAISEESVKVAEVGAGLGLYHQDLCRLKGQWIQLKTFVHASPLYMEQDKTDDKTTQVSPCDLMISEVDIRCSNTTCNRRILQEEISISSDKRMSSIQIPQSMIFTPEELRNVTRSNFEANRYGEGSSRQNRNQADDIQAQESEVEIKNISLHRSEQKNERDNIPDTSGRTRMLISPSTSEEADIEADESETPIIEERSTIENWNFGRSASEVAARDIPEGEIVAEQQLEDNAVEENSVESSHELNWKYDGINQPTDLKKVRVSTNDIITNTYELDESEYTQSEASGTSFWSSKLSDFSKRFSSAPTVTKKYFAVESQPGSLERRGSNITDVLSSSTMNFSANFTPAPLITRNRIISFVMDKRYYVHQEIKLFREQLKDEPLFLSSLLIFLIYYIIYFVSYCGVVCKCIC